MSAMNRKIAEMRGWQVLSVPDGYVLFNANLETVDKVSDAQHINALWEASAPDYEHDLNAAFELIYDRSFYITSSGGNVHFPNSMAVWVGNNDKPVIGEPTPASIARAICEAWLAWHEAETA